MIGRDRHLRLDRLIEDVSRGRRELASIREDDLRESVRVALRIHRDAPAVPDEYTRLRMRARVMAGLERRDTGLRGTAWVILELLARPAPYIVRAIAVASLLATLAMAAIVASADTLPDDLLYPVKTGTEDVRLALAVGAEDRASVELSIAEHRLREAQRLAAVGRISEALVASASYSQHVAIAAAELAPIASSSAARQLESHFATQRDRARSFAATLEATATASEILTTIARSPVAPAPTGVQRVADTAATVAAELVKVAERAQAAASAGVTPDVATAVAPLRPAAAPTARSARAESVLMAVRRASWEAHAAAERAKRYS